MNTKSDANNLNLIKSWDALIKEGKSQKVIQFWTPVWLKNCIKSWSTSERLAVASLCRRTGEYELALRLLNSEIQQMRQSEMIKWPEIQIEYSANLIQLGAHLEGRKLLMQLNYSQKSQQNMFLAFSYFTEWDYESAIPFLAKYLAQKNLTNYEKLVGNVNLLAALVSTKKTIDAENLGKEILNEVKKENLILLETNTLEILAQNSWIDKNIKTAQNRILQAEKKLLNIGRRDQLYIEKWKWIFELNNKKSTNKIKNELLVLQKKARQNHAWEILRDLDLHFAINTNNSFIAKKLFFGTPYTEYKKKLLLNFDAQIFNGDFTLSSSPNSRKSSHIYLNSNQATVFQNNDNYVNKLKMNIHFKPGELKHRLLKVLCSDLYAPWSCYRLFQSIYPNEYFNLSSSRQRIYQSITDFRIWAKNLDLSLKIESSNEGFYFEPGVNLVVHYDNNLKKNGLNTKINHSQYINLGNKITGFGSELRSGSELGFELGSKSEIRLNSYIQILFNIFQYTQFSATDLKNKFKFSDRTIRRLLLEAQKTKIIEKVSGGRSTKYKYINLNNK